MLFVIWLGVGIWMNYKEFGAHGNNLLFPVNVWTHFEFIQIRNTTVIFRSLCTYAYIRYGELLSIVYILLVTFGFP